MPRPRQNRNITGNPAVTFYKPQGVPLRMLENICLSLDEYEALRLKFHEKKTQTQSAQQMHVSQSTFQRILSSALEKIGEALVEGKSIEIRTDK